ncbi:carboxymuconolactone decarboxylase family protein [Sphingopyxis sp. MWB1]|uniref:carboxymuconolactone decarboxylase family protein n=1 Tax=Sphingopyxis sp. MWB1 TaxID=1537715 RepID=UPI000519EDFF|nr:carboxymuconolactone decarboxylase family protein [Sphingopyxis sp. MWB1]
MAHLRPLELDEVQDEEILAAWKEGIKKRGFVVNAARTMARRPNILKAYTKLNNVVMYEGTVDGPLKMLLTLARSLASGCRYCQSHMTNLSNRYGASDEKIQALWEFETSELFSDAERAAIRVAFKAGQLPNETTKEDIDALLEHFDEGEVIEIVACICLFGWLNCWNETLATQAEDVAVEATSRILGGQGWEPGKHA